MVHERGGLDDPGVGPVGLRVVALFGAIHVALFLRLSNEHHPVSHRTAPAYLSGHIFFALPLEKLHHGNPVLLSKPLDVGDESTRHRLYGIGGSDLRLLLMADEAYSSLGDLQARHDGIEIHAINAFHFQHNVLAQNLGNRL